MKKTLFVFLSLILLSSCGSLSYNPNSVVGTWEFVDVDLDIKSDSPAVDRIIKTAFAAYTTLGGGMDQLRGIVKFDNKGRCTTPKFSCDYTYYGNTLTLKQKLLNAAGVNTKFTIERQYNEMYLIYDAKEALSLFTIGLSDADLRTVQKANIILIYRKK